MKNNFISYLILMILSAVFFDTFAQIQPVQQPEPKKKEVRVYKISEIPGKIEAVSAFLTKVYTELTKPEEVKKLKTELSDILKNYSSLKARTDSINLSEQLTITLKELKQRWNIQKKKISDYTVQLSGKTEKLEEQKELLTENKSIWLRTDSLAGMEKANTKIRIKISNILDRFNKVENLIANDINALLDLQTEVSKENVLVNSILQKIDNLLAAKQQEIFVRNAPPIWESISGKEDTTNLSYQVKYISDSYSRISKAFYEENKDKIVPAIIYFLLLLSLILILRQYTKNFQSEDPIVKRAQNILKAPVSASIIISLIALSLFYSDTPEFYSSLIRILVVLPLIFVLKRIISNTLKVPLYLFALILILQQIMLTTENNTGVERALLILINVIVLVVLIWILRTKRFDNAFTTGSYNNIGVILTKIMIILFIITLIINFIGYVALSFMLINGTIISIYSIIIIITAALTLEGVIMIFLQTKTAGLLNVVRNYPDKIHRVIHKILKLVFSIGIVIIVLNNFSVRKIVTDWLVETLGHKWSIGDFSITLGDLAIFIFSIWLSIIVARFVRFILEGDVLPRFNLARGVPGAISVISSYVIIGFGIMVAIRGAGIDLNSFALLAGALGVGIGFGLQDIVRNFISGLIIIFERPIQIGDAVQVEDLSGRVQHIGIRSSIIKTWEGAEVIVPNGNLISNKLINWTFADQLRRIDIKVGVAYGTNVNLVMETLLECAGQNEKLLVSPPPLVLFNDFGESSLDFELRCWISDFESWFKIKSDLRVSIEKAFGERNIEIPFPQRVLHMKPRSAKD